MEVNVTLKADKSGLVGEFKSARTEVDAMTKSVDRLGQSAGAVEKNQGILLKSMRDMNVAARQNADTHRQLDDQLTKFMSRLDPAYRAVRELDGGHDLLTRGLKAGLLSQKDYESALGKMQAKWGAVIGEQDKAAVSTAYLAREMRTLFNEVIDGRGRDAMGTLAQVSTRIAGLGIAGIGAAVGIGVAVAGTLALVAAGERSDRAISGISAQLIATGRAGELSAEQLRQYIAAMSQMPNISRGAAEAVMGAMAAIPGMTGPEIQKVTALVGDFATATGQQAEQAGQQLARAFSKPAEGAKALHQQLGIVTYEQQLQIESLARMGRTSQATALLTDILSKRVKGLTNESLTPMKAATSDVTKSMQNLWQSFLDSSYMDTAQQKITRMIGWAQTALHMFDEDKPRTVTGKIRGLPPEAPDPRSAIEAGAAVAGGYQGAAGQLQQLKENAVAVRAALAQAAPGTKEYESFSRALGRINAQMAELTSNAALVQGRANIQFGLEKETVGRGLAEIDEALSRNLVSYDSYYQAKESMQRRAIEQEIANRQVALTIARGELGRAEPGKQANDARAKVEEIQAKIAELTRSAADIPVTIEREARRASVALGNELMTANASMLEATGRTVDAQFTRLSQQYGPLIQRLEAQGNEAGAEFIRGLINVELARSRMAELQTQIDTSLSALGEKEKSLQIQQQAGLITSVELQQKVIALHREQARALEELLPSLQAAAEANGNPQAIATVERLRARIAELRGTGAELNRTFGQGAKEAFDVYIREISDAGRAGERFASGALRSLEDDLARTFKTGKLSVKSFADFFIDEFARIQARAIIRPIAQATSSGIGGIFSGLGKLFGFDMPGASAGGAIGEAGAADLIGMTAAIAHSGGVPAFDRLGSRVVPASTFIDAPRFHTGVGAGERAAIIRDEEAVLTPGQMKMLSPAGSGGSVVYSPTINIDARGAQQGVETQLRSQFRALLSQHRDELVGLVDRKLNGRGRRLVPR